MKSLGDKWGMTILGIIKLFNTVLNSGVFGDCTTETQGVIYCV